MENNTNKKRIFLVAGEPSGDKIAAGLMRALKEKDSDIEIIGVGGVQMKAEGLKSLFPIEDLSVMGFFEVLPKLSIILKRIKFTAEEIIKQKPDAVVFFDAPDFCFRVAKKVKHADKSIPLIHYVAPTVWAWREGRAKKIAKFLDHMITLFPFEPKYFKKYGLDSICVGHQVVEKSLDKEVATKDFRKLHKLKDSENILTILPGSRVHEIHNLLHVFCDSILDILEVKPNMVVFIPTLPHLKPELKKIFKGRGINPIVITDESEKYNCFAASNFAIAASGTVSLELALTGTPHLIAYKVNPLSAMIVKIFVKTKFFNIVNIILNKEVVPELLQDKCTSHDIVETAIKLIDDKKTQNEQQSSFEKVMKSLGVGDQSTPSQKAADYVLKIIDKERK